ncbi:MAG: homoserine O-succinyltransferase MetA [Candidatus Acidiferrales bacterium]
MPLMLKGGQTPARWTRDRRWQALGPRDHNYEGANCIEIALINNMPDAALADTERQFCELISAAAGDIPLRIQLYSLPEIYRSAPAQQHMHGRYLDMRDLLNNRFDAVIITGTEPRQPDLRQEAYWQTLVEVLDWAERNTTSTILSCLAAHASVLHSNAIERHLLDEKRFGVFDEKQVSQHTLTADVPDVIRIPHSRWNELRENDLVACGYVVLTKSKEAGVGLFAKQMRGSLFVYVQGHPEYETQTLLKEYRRDVKRFLRRERESYPLLPHGYLNAEATKRLCDFRDQAISKPQEDVLAAFPDSFVSGTLQNGWHACGALIYRNWLRYLASRKTDAAHYSVMATASGRDERRRAAAR